MPSNSPTLRERYAADLRSGSTAVVLTAVLVGVVAAVAAALYAPSFEWGFLLMILIGVLLPMAHERHWPQTSGWARDVGWTLLASASTTGLFVAGALIAGWLGMTPIWSAVVAFLVTTVIANLGIRWLAP